MADFNDLANKLKAAVAKLAQPTYMRSLGEKAADIIRLRTKLGYGVREDGEERAPLKPLSDGYKDQRKKFDRLSEDTTPGRSNLTRSGQMLDSIGVTDVSSSTVKVGPKGSRDDGKDNAEIAGYVTEQGRAFNNLSGTEKKRLSDGIAKDLKLELQKTLTKR